VLYKIYRDAEALAAHNSSPCPPRMLEEYKDLITDKRVIVGDIN
jgi:quinol monooxygenase YgiN